MSSVPNETRLDDTGDHSRIARTGTVLQMLRQDWEENVPECSGWEISRIFLGKIRFPENGIRERRPLTHTM